MVKMKYHNSLYIYYYFRIDQNQNKSKLIKSKKNLTFVETRDVDKKKNVTSILCFTMQKKS